LIIGSDYLYPKDSVLFEPFTEKNGTKIKIVHLSSEELINKLNVNPYNSQIDLILLSSKNDIDTLKKLNHLHSLSSAVTGIQKMEINNSHSVLVGINPIVTLIPRNESADSMSYKKLSEQQWYSDFDETSIFRFYSGLQEKYNWSNTELINWLNRADKNRSKFAFLDSTFRTPCFLTSYSKALMLKADTSKGFQSYQISFPDKFLNGSLYSTIHLAMITQSPNYVTAVKFINFYNSEKGMSLFNQKQNTLSPLELIDGEIKLENNNWKVYKKSLNQNLIDFKNWRNVLQQARTLVILPVVQPKHKMASHDTIKK